MTEKSDAATVAQTGNTSIDMRNNDVSSRSGEQDSVELRTVGGYQDTPGSRSRSGYRLVHCGCCWRPEVNGGTVWVAVRTIGIILLTSLVWFIVALFLVPSTSGQTVKISGHVTIIENAIDSLLLKSPQLTLLPVRLMKDLCFPANVFEHIFQFQLEQLMKRCKLGQLHSVTVTISESGTGSERAAFIQLTFANSSTHHVGLLTEVKERLANSVRENSGYFGVFLLDLNSLRLACENTTRSTSEGHELEDKSLSDVIIGAGLIWSCGIRPTDNGCYPNILGHVTKSDAELHLVQLMSRLYASSGHVTSSCNENLSDFACQLYLPQCTAGGQPLLPCREYCQQVARDCPELDKLIHEVTRNCELLSNSADSTICTPYPKYETPLRCHSVEASECRQRGYMETSFPNSIGHGGPRTANHDWNKLTYIGKAVDCSEHFVEFSCAAVYPKCTVFNGTTVTVVGPCRSLCQVFKRDCGFFLSMAGLHAITNLDCSKLPQSLDSSVCVGGNVEQHFTDSGSVRHSRRCAADEFTCDDEDTRRCISDRWVCDGRRDCESGADERQCAVCSSSGGVTCSGGWCPRAESVCDGVVNCRDSQDERHCFRLSSKSSDDATFVEMYDASRLRWVQVCLDDNVWTREMQQHFCFTPLFISSNASLGSEVEHRRLIQLLRDRSDCDQYPPLTITCNFTGCTAQSSSNTLLQTTTALWSRDVYIEAFDWPWMVSLHGGPHKTFFCGASVIDADWLLTAAHCVGSLTAADEWTAMGGHSRRVSYTAERQVRSISRVVVHPEFSAYAMHNDIAMLRVDHPFKFESNLQPACLPPVGYVPAEGSTCYVGGWGKSSHRGKYASIASLFASCFVSATGELFTWGPMGK